jgi:hypothetical protein
LKSRYCGAGEMKRLAIILFIACLVSALDSFAVTHDFEPGESGYDSVLGMIGGACFLLSLPMITWRYFLWAYLNHLLGPYGHSVLDFLFVHEVLFSWVTDSLTVFTMVGLFYGSRALWSERAGKRRISN